LVQFFKKINMKKLIIICLLCLIGHTKVADSQSACLSADIVFLADCSSSLEHRWEFIPAYFLDFIDDVTLSKEGVKVSIVSFSVCTETILYPASDKKEAKKGHKDLKEKGKFLGGSTFLSLAMKRSKDLLDYSESERMNPSNHKIIIIISDGVIDDMDSVLVDSQKLRKQGVQIYAIKVGSDDNGIKNLIKITGSENHMSDMGCDPIIKVIKKADPCS